MERDGSGGGNERDYDWDLKTEAHMDLGTGGNPSFRMSKSCSLQSLVAWGGTVRQAPGWKREMLTCWTSCMGFVEVES
jgi:hypothetical protein